MSLRLSSGTLDTMAGVFAPPKKSRLGSGGGKGAARKLNGTSIGIVAASLLTRPSAGSTAYRTLHRAKQAFGGSSQLAISRGAVSVVDRTARRAPEVVVRVTGRQHGRGHVLANFSYISRLGHGEEEALALHTSDGDTIQDGREMEILAQDWHEWEMGDGARRKGATSISMILSMPIGTDPERLKDAALGFARQEFANRSWVASLHVDRDHPHVHLTIARRDNDGRRFHPDRDDLFRYRRRFAEKLREHGIDANATPAKTRGIDPTHEPFAARKVRENGGIPQLDSSRADRIARYRDGGLADPVEAVLARQHAAVRGAYDQALAELKMSPSLVDQAVAKSLAHFVAALQPPQPNSTRSVQPVVADQDRASSRELAPQPGPEANMIDRLTAALAGSRAMRQHLAAGPAMPKHEQQIPAEGHERRPLGKSERLRELVNEADKQAISSIAHDGDDALRQTQARDRAQHNRDRSRDKGGPRR